MFVAFLVFFFTLLGRTCRGADCSKVAVVSVVAEEPAQPSRQLHLEAAQQPRQRPVRI